MISPITRGEIDLASSKLRDRYPPATPVEEFEAADALLAEFRFDEPFGLRSRSGRG